MIKGTQAIVSASLLGLFALHCGGSTPSSKTPNQNQASSSSAESTSGNGSTNNQQSERVPTAGQAAPETSSGSPLGAMEQKAEKAIPLSEEQVAAVANAVNDTQIQQAQLAQKKSSSPQVLDYAKMMIADSTQAKQAQAGLGIGSASSSLTKALSNQGQQTLSKLQNTSGSDFDRKYLQGQIAGHQRVLDMISGELLPNAKTPALQQHLEGMQSTVQRHLQSARDALSSL